MAKAVIDLTSAGYLMLREVIHDAALSRRESGFTKRLDPAGAAIIDIVSYSQSVIWKPDG